MNGHQGPLAFHQEVELLEDFRRNPPLDVVLFQPAGDKKSAHRAQGQAEGGIQQTQGHPEQVAADEAGGLPGDGGEDHLEGLDQDEHQGRQGPRGLEDGLDPMFIGAEARYIAHLAPQEAAVVKAPEQQPQGEKGQNQQSPEPRSVLSARRFRSPLQSLSHALLVHHQRRALRYRKTNEILFGCLSGVKKAGPREPAGFSISQPDGRTSCYNSSRSQALIHWYKYSRYR